MTRLIDLTQTLDPDNRAKLPPHLASVAPVISPAIDYHHPAEKGADEFCRYLGCNHADLPEGEGWGAELMTDMSTHCGTHVDAPLHSGSKIAGAAGAHHHRYRAWMNSIVPGLVLDVRPWVKPCEEITIEMLDAALAATGQNDPAGSRPC